MTTVTLPASGTGDATPKVATEQITGTLEHKQVVALAVPGTASVILIPADAANGLDVDVTRVSGVVHVDDNGSTLSVDDGAGTLSVDDGGGSLTVDGFPAVQPVSDNAGSLTVDNGGTFAVQDSEKVADNAGFTDGTTKVLPAGFVFDEVAGTALTENDAAAGRVDSKRAQVGVLEDATTRGQRAAVSAAGRLSVDASGIAVPVTDNGGLLSVDDGAGTLTVDAPVGTPVFVRLSDGTVALLGQKTMAGSLPVALASDQGNVPVNLAQVGGSAVAIEPVPTGGFGNPAQRVFVNSIRKATFFVNAVNISSGILVANTAKAILSLEHALASTKTVRIRRIVVSGLATAAGGAVVTFNDILISKGTAASSAGTAVTPSKANEAQSAAEATCKTLPTIVAAGTGPRWTTLTSPAAGTAIGTVMPRTIVYDWSEAGSVEPLVLRSGVLESIVINVVSQSTPTFQLSIEVELTEE